jgi:hypothetical protein
LLEICCTILTVGFFSLQNVTFEVLIMPYTNEEGGRLNNFASEPKVYKADPPTKSQQRNYLFLGIVAVALVGGLLAVAFYASQAG